GLAGAHAAGPGQRLGNSPGLAAFGAGDVLPVGTGLLEPGLGQFACVVDGLLLARAVVALAADAVADELCGRRTTWRRGGPGSRRSCRPQWAWSPGRSSGLGAPACLVVPLAEAGVAVYPGPESEPPRRRGGGPPGLLGERVALGVHAVRQAVLKARDQVHLSR